MIAELIDPATLGFILVGVMLFAIFIGFPISFTLIFLGFVFGYLGFGKLVFYLMTLQFSMVMTEQTLAAVPLFVFMGIMMEQAGLMERLFSAFQLMLSKVRGSLYYAVLFVSVIFAAATGIVGASVTILGIMAAKSMNRSGYDVRLAAGTITAGGTLGILIPPSIMLVVMGPIMEIPVIDLFAGVVGSNLENNIKIIKKKIEKKNLENIFINFSLDDLVSIDDMIAFEKKKSNKKFSFYEKIKKNSFIIYINNFIRTKSVIYITLKGYFFKTDEVYYQQAINLYKSENNLKFLEKLIEDISELENNSKIVFIMIPYNYQIRKGNCKQDDLAEKEIVKAMANKNIKLIRLKKNFCEDKNPDKIFFSFDPAHLSNYGHKLVAKILMMRLN